MGTAIKNDGAKAPMHLIDPGFLESMARVLGHGERKYGGSNWMHDLGYSRLASAAMRHMVAFQGGEDADSETGESHLVHAACSLMMLEYYRCTGGFTDDRIYKESRGAAQRWNSPAVPELRRVKTHSVLRSKPDQESGLDVSPVLDQEKAGEPGKCQDAVRILQDRIKIWADSVFPDRTAHNALCKLVMEEIPELLNGGLDDPMEYADVLILILDVASLRGIDAIQAAHEKMDVNISRSWAKDPVTGLLHHIDKGDEQCGL